MPVSIGALAVNPGDIVIGDEDSVVTFAPTEAEFLIVAVKAQQDQENEILASIRAGTYSGSYAGVAPRTQSVMSALRWIRKCSTARTARARVPC